MNELAGRLNITAGALTGHVKKLEECGVLKVSAEGTGHGNVKRCSVVPDRILIDFRPKDVNKNTWQVSLKVGQFSECEVWPTCGMASKEGLIGELDDVRYFSHPARFAADILWFGRGYVEYTVPCFIPVGSRIDCLTISAELSSEAPGVNGGVAFGHQLFRRRRSAGKMDLPRRFRKPAGTSESGMVA